jgi:CubicO group peptidase (beta-lactamase class C family)
MGAPPLTPTGPTFLRATQEHFFDALSMNSTTVSVAKAQKLPHGQLSEGFLRSGRNLQLGQEGVRTAIQPFFIPEGEEEIWRGAGGVLTSARDLVCILSLILIVLMAETLADVRETANVALRRCGSRCCSATASTRFQTQQSFRRKSSPAARQA